MAAQKVCFTIFGNESKDGLHDIIRLQEELSNKIIDEIVIDGKSKYNDAYKNVETSFDRWYADAFK